MRELNSSQLQILDAQLIALQYWLTLQVFNNLVTSQLLLLDFALIRTMEELHQGLR